MPKRSNAFQRIVHALYDAIKPLGGTVTESAQLPEPGGALREIDVLAESVVYGVKVRIAVEVRGRSRKDDVQWIDSLIGKYTNLPVDKIIAVSATGFSATAQAKADSAGIQVLSGRDAETVDWPAEFQKIGAGLVTRSDKVEVSIRTEPAGRRDLGRDSRVTDESGQDLGSLGEFVELVADRHRTRLTAMLGKRFFEFYKTLADLGKILVSEDVLKVQATLWVQTTNGDRIPIVHAAVRAHTTHVVSKIPMRHTAISTHMVSSIEVPEEDGTRVELFAIQSSDKPRAINVQIRSDKPRKQAGTRSARKRSNRRNRPG